MIRWSPTLPTRPGCPHRRLRRLLLRDPALPDVLLPSNWPGHKARQLCRELYRRLLTASERHLDSHLQLADGHAPEASTRLLERFQDADPLLDEA